MYVHMYTCTCIIYMYIYIYYVYVLYQLAYMYMYLLHIQDLIIHMKIHVPSMLAIGIETIIKQTQ